MNYFSKPTIDKIVLGLLELFSFMNEIEIEIHLEANKTDILTVIRSNKVTS